MRWLLACSVSAAAVYARSSLGILMTCYVTKMMRGLETKEMAMSNFIIQMIIPAEVAWIPFDVHKSWKKYIRRLLLMQTMKAARHDSSSYLAHYAMSHNKWFWPFNYRIMNWWSHLSTALRHFEYPLSPESVVKMTQSVWIIRAVSVNSLNYPKRTEKI